MAVDHFDLSNRATFPQRYLVNLEHYVQGGPVFVYISGEAQMGPGTVDAGEAVEMAKELNGAVFALEHRYYGESVPTPDLSTENLKWLTFEQGLEDLAFFRSYIRELYSLTESKFVIIGGSYAGAMSAWTRLKYPHLFDLSVSSSGPVLAKEDYFEYDEAIVGFLGEQCTEDVQNVVHYLESVIDSHNQSAVDQMKEIGRATSELQSHSFISYAVFCLKKKKLRNSL
eukprot:TRINITY_DN2122_c0_g1_i1.p1 TRINITY_DN2122_c0_g1~~TRINITY_DN2122_c0_g1_i1.p1  ORF type:complete len:265 (+),score=52.98 TRINITY_DN2122_c0_g1_i1:115-795(+)